MRAFIFTVLFICPLLPVCGQEGIYAELLSKRGVSNQVIRDAFLTVDRASFADEGSERYLSKDTEVPYPDGGFLIKPSLALSCLTCLQPLPEERCLVTGSNTGYIASLLAHICKDMYVVEESAGKTAAYGNIIESYAAGSVSVLGSDALDDLLDTGPFDIIMLSSAAGGVSDDFIQALGPGGRILAPLEEPGGFQVLVIIQRTQDSYSIQALRDCFFP